MSRDRSANLQFYRIDTKKYSNLRDLEDRLGELVDKVKFLGQIDLTTDGKIVIESMIEKLYRNNEAYISSLFRKYPHSFSVYLVQKGIFEYDGSYWASVREDLDLDSNEQSRLGSLFTDHLQEMGLTTAKSSGRRKYVDNILTQSLIPISELRNFIEEVKNSQPTNEPTIAKYTQILQDLRNKLNKTSTEINKIDNTIGTEPKKLLKHWSDLGKLSQLEARIEPIRGTLENITGSIKSRRRKFLVTMATLKRKEVSLKHFLHQLNQDKDTSNKAGQKAETKLREVGRRQDRLNGRISRLERKLLEMGNGDLEEGISTFKTKKKEYKEYRKLKRELDEKIDLTSLLELKDDLQREIVTDGDSGRDFIQNKMFEKEKLLQKRKDIQEQIEEIEKEVESFSKPIQLFLINGGPFVRTIFIEMKSAIRDLEDNKKILPENYDLPQRYINFVSETMKAPDAQDSEPNVTTKDIQGQAIKEPRVLFDLRAEEIVFRLPPQRIKGIDGATETKFCINENCYPLNAYKGGEDIYETSALEKGISHAKSSYKTILKKKDNVLGKWEFRAFRGNGPILVFDSSKEIFQREELPAELIWLIAPKTFSLQQDYISRGQLHGNWVDFDFYRIDTTERSEINLYEPSIGDISLPVEREGHTSLKLSAGTKVEGATVNGAPIFVDFPEIELPIKSTDGLADWNCVVHSYPSIGQIDPQIDLSLEQLLNDRTGSAKYIKITEDQLKGNDQDFLCYRIVLNNPEIEYESEISFCHIHDFSYKFNKQIFLPRHLKDKDGHLTVKKPDSIELTLNSEGALRESKPDFVRADFSLQEDIIKFETASKDDRPQTNLEIKINVPKANWTIPQLSGKYLEESSGSKTLYFFQDLQKPNNLDLHVSLPKYINKTATLNLSNSRNSAKKRVVNGEVEYNLQKFLDSLRKGRKNEETNQTFSLKISDSERFTHAIRLFSVQNYWEVKDLEVAVESCGEEVKVVAHWNTVGKADNQVVLIWRKRNHERVYKRELDTTKEEFKKVLPKNKLPKGTYIFHVTNQPPFAGSNIEYPYKKVRIYEQGVDIQPATIADEDEVIEHKSYVDKFKIT